MTGNIPSQQDPGMGSTGARVPIMGGRAGRLLTPMFTEEPPRVYQFTNSTGGSVRCAAAGGTDPPLVISWKTQDGRAVTQVRISFLFCASISPF